MYCSMVYSWMSTLCGQRACNPVIRARARVPGFALRIGQRATLVPDPKAHVYGVLMELSHDEIERVYAEPK